MKPWLLLSDEDRRAIQGMSKVYELGADGLWIKNVCGFFPGKIYYGMSFDPTRLPLTALDCPTGPWAIKENRGIHWVTDVSMYEFETKSSTYSFSDLVDKDNVEMYLPDGSTRPFYKLST